MTQPAPAVRALLLVLLLWRMWDLRFVVPRVTMVAAAVLSVEQW